MSDESKSKQRPHREFWIDDVSSDFWYLKAVANYDDTEKFVGRTVHVIEASYVNELEAKLEVAIKALERLANVTDSCILGKWTSEYELRDWAREALEQLKKAGKV